MLITYFCAEPEKPSSPGWMSPLKFLASQGYKVSKKKVQLYLPQVIYLGMVLKGQTHSLNHKCIDPILHYPLPQTIRQLRAFLGVTRFWRIWIPRYADRPIYQLLKDAQRNSQSLLEWDPENTKHFRPSNSHSKQPQHWACPPKTASSYMSIYMSIYIERERHIYDIYRHICLYICLYMRRWEKPWEY
jgi:hypothetical protein